MAAIRKPSTGGALQPVIILEAAVPGFGLRASFDQHGLLFLALIHIESGTATTISASHSGNVIRASTGGLQIGTVVYLLAPGEAERFFSWLQTGNSYPSGVN